MQKGRAKLTVPSARGKEATIARCGRGGLHGWGVLPLTSLCELRLPPLLHSVVLRIEKDAMLNVVHREHVFSYLLSRTGLVVTTRLGQTQLTSFSILLRSVGSDLLLRARFGKKGRAENVVPSKPRNVAEMRGTTPSWN